MRAQVPSAGRRVQLNAGTLGPWPTPTIEAMRAQLDHEALDRQPPELWTGLGALQADVRELAARLCGIGVGNVALAHATHEGINACLWGLDLAPGDNLVTTDEEHPGLLVPLRIARDRRGAELRIAPMQGDPVGITARIAGLVDERTRAVLVSHVSWSSGLVLPLAAIAAAIAPVPLIVDGAQGAGAMAVSAADGWAAYTVSGQKWSLGPNGAGALALADPAAWQPTSGAFFTVTDPARPLEAPFSTDGRRFEFAQEAWQPLVGWRASLRFLFDEAGGPEAAQNHARALNAVARELLEPIPGIDELSGHAHLLCARMPGRAVEVSAALAAKGIVVRPIGSDVLRLSFGFWNDLDDLARAAQAIGAALA
jgi:L-cysteine/cystine lyase